MNWNASLNVAAQGGYHTGSLPDGGLSARDKLKRFGVQRSIKDYGGMNRRGK